MTTAATPFDRTYSPEELQEMLKRMERASNAFYVLAVKTGCHAFIEFTGLMNEYIKVCRATLVAGKDFTCSNVHQGGEALVMQDFEAHYLGEKLGCIFARTFRDPKMLDAFLQGFSA